MIHKNLDGSYDLEHEETGAKLFVPAGARLADIEAVARDFLAPMLPASLARAIVERLPRHLQRRRTLEGQRVFINTKNGQVAWLIAHDLDVTYALGSPAEDRPRHTVGSFEFFSTHREGTPDEIEEFEDGQHRAARRALDVRAPLKLPKVPRKAKAVARGTRTAAPAEADTPPPSAADKSPAPASAGGEAARRGPGGEPHGE